jgi:hypothetical protein
VPFVFSNNCSTTLAAPITTTGQTTIVLASSAHLPTLTAGQTFNLTLNDAATQSVFEILTVTAIAGANLTVVRGQEGTAATTWLTGDFAYGALTAGQLASFLTTSTGFVDLTTNQTIGGIKTFTNAVIPSGYVDLANPQTIGGIKTFSSAPVMSGGSILAGSVAPAALSSIVSSLNTLLGALNLASSDGSVTITPSGTTINLAAAIAKLYINGSIVLGQVHIEIFSGVSLGGGGSSTISFGASYTNPPAVVTSTNTANANAVITAVGTTSFHIFTSNAATFLILCGGI